MESFKFSTNLDEQKTRTTNTSEVVGRTELLSPDKARGILSGVLDGAEQYAEVEAGPDLQNIKAQLVSLDAEVQKHIDNVQSGKQSADENWQSFVTLVKAFNSFKLLAGGLVEAMAKKEEIKSKKVSELLDQQLKDSK